MWLICASLASWLAALAAVATFLWFYHSGAPNMGGDLEAAVVYGTIGVVAMIGLMYLPVMNIVHQRTLPHRSFWLLPLTGAGLAIVPVMLAFWWVSWDGFPTAFLSLEILFIVALFVPSGFVFGFGYALHRSKHDNALILRGQ